MSGTIFFICSTSAISALSLLCQEFQLDQLHQKDGEKDARTKRRKQDCGEIRPTAMNLAISVSTSSSSVNSPIASRSPGVLKASSRQIGSSGKLDVRSNQIFNPAASSSQGLQRDAPLDISTGEPVGTCTIWTRRISSKPLKLQNIQKIRNPKVEFGQIIPFFTTLC